jgi:hypothetical protein
MAISERSPEDKQKLKSGIHAVVILVACGMLGPVIMAEVTGVNVDTLCVTTDGETDSEQCLDDEGYKGEFKSGLKEGLNFWLPLAVFMIGSIVIAYLGIKY